MSIRAMSSSSFYPVSQEECKKQIEELAAGFQAPDEPASLVAGIVPHAGWQYSGAVAARVWKCLRAKSQPKTIILFGAVHHPDVPENTVYPEGSWETPVGSLEVDSKLAQILLKGMKSLLVAGVDAHHQEHSIEVQLPFIHEFFPDCKILPIAVPPNRTPVQFGDKIGHITRDMSVIAVGSTDLTHYGERYGYFPRGSGPSAHEWMRGNDRRVLDLIETLQAPEIQPEVAAHHNACGPGALAATVAFAGARGAERGILLNYTTSYDVCPDREFNMAVGYAGMVF